MEDIKLVYIREDKTFDFFHCEDSGWIQSGDLNPRGY